MIRQVGGPGNYIAMVVDSRTLGILSSCCSVYDVLNDGVTIVELISKQRQPLPELNALYFLSPFEDSVQALIKDFKDDKKPQYGSAYVYFSAYIPNSSKIMTSLADSPSLLPRIRCLVEFNLSFVAYEQRVFHFGMPDALFQLFPLPSPYLLQKIADDLVSLCVTMGQKPAIRYHRNQLPWCEQLATLVHKGLKSEKIPPSDERDTILLILDRSVDLAPLFVHEYTYQALAYDVLELPVCCLNSSKASHSDTPEVLEDVFEYDVTNNMGVVERKKAILGEQDEVWVRYRHQHIQDVNQSVQEEIQLFLKENSTARMQQNMATTSEDTLKAIRSLPQYQEALSRYWTHVTLSEKCFDKLQDLKIMTVGAVEQDLCCGVDKDGKEISATKLLAAVASLVSDGTVGSDEKLRLLLLEFTQMLGMDTADRTKASTR
ncbi:syntaxin binding protein, putative [Eimeria tenella]|uniref:Syntaxin binding protein, putative n=1 Tax=Eimeria tenella TaxID=5802 RepID=U6L2Q4_EIMTE|nr:syntaxin binding protein, putative [Eimeria tenella]CDJ42050.1 syntaxin binding protein, putative [Eimeria tenella]|eukprot:XP_013232800.1 syntaxin binding protein, putative [Eimeria tenella]